MRNVYYFVYLIESLSEVRFFAEKNNLIWRDEPHTLIIFIGRKRGILIFKCIDWWFDFDSELTTNSLYNYSIEFELTYTFL